MISITQKNKNNPPYMKNTHHMCPNIPKSSWHRCSTEEFFMAILKYCYYQKCKKVNIDHLSLS